MEQHLQVLSQALNKANQTGSFTLNESAMVANSLNAVTQFIKRNQKEDAIEAARKERIEKEANAKRLTQALTPVEPLEKGLEGEESTKETPESKL